VSGAASCLECIAQRAKFVVLRAADHLVRADDLLSLLHLMLDRGDGAHQVFATDARRRWIRDDRRTEKAREQTDVQRIADGARRIRMDQPRPRQQRTERRDVVGRDAALLVPTPQDQPAANGVEHTGRRHATGQPSLEDAPDGLAQGGSPAGLCEVRCLVDRKLEPVRRRDLLDRRNSRARVGRPRCGNDRLVEASQLTARGIERCWHIDEDWFGGAEQLIPLPGQLGLRFRHGESERRDHVVAGDRSNLVDRDFDRGRCRKERRCQRGEPERDPGARAVVGER
jgi:hypothetical protein